MTPLIPLMATCSDESKIILEKELRTLGAQDIVPGPGIVHFQVSEKDFYRAHLKLRTCDQIFYFLRHFSTKTGIMFFDQARRVNWPQFLGNVNTYHVQIQGRQEANPIPPEIILRKLREAIIDSFQKTGKKAPTPIPGKGESDAHIIIYLHGGKASLGLVTSGKTMHKRGYRLEGHPAPLKENLASSVLQLAGYDGSQPLLDPMCGSGTIVIEAAQIALAKAPLIHRKKGEFAFEKLGFFNPSLWKEVLDETRNERIKAPGAPIWASDINANFVALARQSALKARVERNIQFHVGDFLQLKKELFAPAGLIVCNLPYGERLGQDSAAELEDLYRQIGDTLKKNFSGWKAALLVATASPWKSIGLHATKKIQVRNGGIPCQLMVFELFSGSRRAKLSALPAHISGQEAPALSSLLTSPEAQESGPRPGITV